MDKNKHFSDGFADGHGSKPPSFPSNYERPEWYSSPKKDESSRWHTDWNDKKADHEKSTDKETPSPKWVGTKSNKPRWYTLDGKDPKAKKPLKSTHDVEKYKKPPKKDNPPNNPPKDNPPAGGVKPKPKGPKSPIAPAANAKDLASKK